MSDKNQNASAGFTHEKVETNNFLMIVLILLVIAIGGLVEIVPLFFQKSTTEAVTGVQPYSSLQLIGCWRIRVRPSVPVGQQTHRP